MKKNKLYLIAGIALGIGATIIAIMTSIEASKKKLHLFDMSHEQDAALIESIIPNQERRS